MTWGAFVRWLRCLLTDHRADRPARYDYSLQQITWVECACGKKSGARPPTSELGSR